MTDIIGSLYAPIFYNLVLILCLIKVSSLQREENSLMWMFAIFFSIVIGCRPITIHFLDTIGYAYAYEEALYWSFSECLQVNDYLFNILMYVFRKMNLSVHIFFTFIASIYIGFAAWTSLRLSKKNAYLIFLGIISCFSFYSYGVNGIRNGLAISLVMLAITFVEKRKLLVVALLWCASAIHNSVLLPIVCIIISYFYKNTKFYIIFWLLCLIFVNIDSHTVEAFLLNIGFIEDDRFSKYLVGIDNKSDFAFIGFRWDFLLYSSIPIVVAYYFNVKKNFQDNLYRIFSNTYILANSFWVLVINASFSNRFAYLSWFLYAIVLVYPFVAYPDLPQRKKKISYVLVGNALFTWGMWLIGGL